MFDPTSPSREAEFRVVDALYAYRTQVQAEIKTAVDAECKTLTLQFDIPKAENAYMTQFWCLFESVLDVPVGNRNLTAIVRGYLGPRNAEQLMSVASDIIADEYKQIQSFAEPEKSEAQVKEVSGSILARRVLMHPHSIFLINAYIGFTSNNPCNYSFPAHGVLSTLRESFRLNVIRFVSSDLALVPDSGLPLEVNFADTTFYMGLAMPGLGHACTIIDVNGGHDNKHGRDISPTSVLVLDLPASTENLAALRVLTEETYDYFVNPNGDMTSQYQTSREEGCLLPLWTHCVARAFMLVEKALPGSSATSALRQFRTDKPSGLSNLMAELEIATAAKLKRDELDLRPACMPRRVRGEESDEECFPWSDDEM